MTTNIIYATITAYCACSHCTPGHGVTAAGNTPVHGITIAAPRNFPLGGIVIWRGRRFVIQDRTALRFDGRFDVYMRTHAEALRFGKRREQVTVITP